MSIQKSLTKNQNLLKIFSYLKIYFLFCNFILNEIIPISSLEFNINNKQNFKHSQYLNFNKETNARILQKINTNNTIKLDNINGLKNISSKIYELINEDSDITYTNIDILDQNTSQNFNFNLTENLKEFLKEFYQDDINLLSSNDAYKNYTNKSYKKRTILLGVDAVVQSCIDFKKYSAFQFLMENGSYNFKTRSTTEGVSGPGWSSILCSLNSKDTGIVNNYWNAPWLSEENQKNYQYATPLNGLNKSFPCIFDQIKKQKPNFKNVIYSCWDYFTKNNGNIAYPKSIDIYIDCLVPNPTRLVEYTHCDDYSWNKSKNLVLKDFDLYFIYLTEMDVSGHIYGFCSGEYLSRVEKLNKNLLDFFEYLKALNILDKINIILTSDHGTDADMKGHGGDKNDGNLLVPLFMMGPDFRKNRNLDSKISTVDIATTIAIINDIEPSDLWKGKPIYEAINRNIINFNNQTISIIFLDSFDMKYNLYIIFIFILCLFKM